MDATASIARRVREEQLLCTDRILEIARCCEMYLNQDSTADLKYPALITTGSSYQWIRLHQPRKQKVTYYMPYSLNMMPISATRANPLSIIDHTPLPNYFDCIATFCSERDTAAEHSLHQPTADNQHGNHYQHYSGKAAGHQHQQYWPKSSFARCWIRDQAHS